MFYSLSLNVLIHDVGTLVYIKCNEVCGKVPRAVMCFFKIVSTFFFLFAIFVLLRKMETSAHIFLWITPSPSLCTLSGSQVL